MRYEVGEASWVMVDLPRRHSSHGILFPIRGSRTGSVTKFLSLMSAEEGRWHKHLCHSWKVATFALGAVVGRMYSPTAFIAT